MNTKTSARKINCHKCNGTGTVERYLDVKAGVCFDCNGTGTTTYVEGSSKQIIFIKRDMVEVGLRVRGTAKNAPVETVASFGRHPEFGDVTIVTTDAGRDYWVAAGMTPQLRLA